MLLCIQKTVLSDLLNIVYRVPKECGVATHPYTADAFYTIKQQKEHRNGG